MNQREESGARSGVASTPAMETWELPTEPRNRPAAIAGGVALVFGLLGSLLWRAYGPLSPPRARHSPAREARPAGTQRAFAAPPRR